MHLLAWTYYLRHRGKNTRDDKLRQDLSIFIDEITRLVDKTVQTHRPSSTAELFRHASGENYDHPSGPPSSTHSVGFRISDHENEFAALLRSSRYQSTVITLENVANRIKNFEKEDNCLYNTSVPTEIEFGFAKEIISMDERIFSRPRVNLPSRLSHELFNLLTKIDRLVRSSSSSRNPRFTGSSPPRAPAAPTNPGFGFSAPGSVTMSPNIKRTGRILGPADKRPESGQCQTQTGTRPRSRSCSKERIQFNQESSPNAEEPREGVLSHLLTRGKKMNMLKLLCRYILVLRSAVDAFDLFSASQRDLNHLSNFGNPAAISNGFQHHASIPGLHGLPGINPLGTGHGYASSQHPYGPGPIQYNPTMVEVARRLLDLRDNLNLNFQNTQSLRYQNPVRDPRSRTQEWRSENFVEPSEQDRELLLYVRFLERVVTSSTVATGPFY